MVLERRVMSRRTLLRGAVLGGTGLLAAYAVGCSDDDDDDAGATTAAPATTPAASGESDAKEFNLVSGWFRGDEVKYYDFGMNTKLASGSALVTAPIYVFITGMDAQGTPQFVSGQHNIVDVVPGDAGYSDLWQVMMVTVGDEYDPDSIKSEADLDTSGLDITTTDMFVNCPIVPEGSTLEGGEALTQGWYKGDPVFYPDFGANPANAIPIWVMITGMDAQGNPQFVEGQMNIIDALPGDAGYSAFWRVNMVAVPADYEANALKSAADVADAGYETTETDLVVNCPVV